MGAPLERREQKGRLQGVRKVGKRPLRRPGAAPDVHPGFRVRRLVPDRLRLRRIKTHDPADHLTDHASATPVATLVHGDGAEPDIEWPRRIIPPDGEPRGSVGFLKQILRLILVADVAAHEPVEVGLGDGHKRG